MSVNPVFPVYGNPFIQQLIDASLDGIELVNHEIEGVVNAVNNELKEFQPAAFERGAEIMPASFGGGDTAADLGSHHNRAHAVMYQTLAGLQADLEQFTTACKQAQQILEDTDVAAADALGRNLRVLDALEAGTDGDEAQGAYDTARNSDENRGDV